MSTHKLVTTIFVMLGIVATPVDAGFVTLSEPSQFSNSQTLITFDEGGFDGHFLQPFEVVKSYRGVDFRSIGGQLDMPEAAFDPFTPREFGPGGNDGKTILNDLSFYTQEQGLEVMLPASINQFGAEFLAVTPGDFTFVLFNGMQQVDFVTIAARQVGRSYTFHAFQDSRAFDRVVIRGPGVSDGRVVMDNLRFAPEPSALVLIGIGAFALSLVSWRRRLVASL